MSENKSAIRHRSLTVGALKYPLIEAGSGPLVILLHGFPDHYLSFSQLVENLASSGFRAVSLSLPGYHPENQRSQGNHDPIYVRDELLKACSILRQEDEGAPCHLVAHDWGAVVGYLMIEAQPEQFTSYCSLSIPAGMSWWKLITRAPSYLINSFYIAIFQVPRFAEWLLRRNNYAFMRFLIGLWSPALKYDREFQAGVMQSMDENNVIESSLDYYRNSFYGLNKASFTTRRLFKQAFHVPVLGLWGNCDFGIPDAAWECISPSQFKSGLTLESYPELGHFVHVEAPDLIAQRLLNWLRRDHTLS